jgi:DUF917 family protein
LRESTTGISNGPVLRGTTKEYRVIITKRDKRVTRRQITETVKMGNISAPVMKEHTPAIQADVSTVQEDVSARKKKKVKMMDINEAQHNMGHMGEAALRGFLNHHNTKATGKFQNCVSCMKWKGQNKAVSEVATNPAKYPGQDYILMRVERFHYQWERKNIG